MSTSKRKAMIIGCGIGGPVVALFLKRIGIETEIFEAEPDYDDEGGYFLNVSSNGLEVLRTLGLDGQMAAEGFPIPRMIMWSGTGKRLGEVRNGAAPGQGAVSVVVKRGTLHRLVREEALRQGITITWGKRLKEIKVTNEQQVIAQFTDGSIAEADLLIGSDGIHSRTRQIIAPHAPKPAYTGLISCGGFLPHSTLEPTPNTQHFIFGKRAFFGYFVKEGGEVWWFSNMAYPGEPRRSDLAAISQGEWQQRLLDLHRNDLPVIQGIIRATESPLGMYPIYDVPSTPIWHRGPVVLMGDAAHATSPSAGQGASLALEDAIVLAKCLRDIPHLEAAFTAYERLRKARAEKVVKVSRSLGNNKAASNELSRWLRDLTLPLILKHFANANAQEWLYSYKVDWQQQVVA